LLMHEEHRRTAVSRRRLLLLRRAANDGQNHLLNQLLAVPILSALHGRHMPHLQLVAVLHHVRHIRAAARRTADGADVHASLGHGRRFERPPGLPLWLQRRMQPAREGVQCADLHDL
jgi:hypothetical protein